MANDVDYDSLDWAPIQQQKDDFESLDWKPVSETAPTKDTRALDRIREMGLGVARGARESIPLAKDISAASRAYLGNPLTGQAPSGDFAREKETVQRQQREAQEAAPGSFLAGEIAPYLTPLGRAGSAANMLGKGEQIIASKLAPYVTSPTLRKIGAAATTGAGVGAVHGFGEGTDLSSRFSEAGSEGVGGGIAGGALSGAGSALGKLYGSSFNPFKSTAVEKAGKDIGVSIPASISSDNPVARTLAQTLGGLPFTKDILESGTKRGISALEDVVQKSVPGVTPGMQKTAAGQSAADSLRDWYTKGAAEAGQQLFGNVKMALGENGELIRAPMENTRREIEKILRQRGLTDPNAFATFGKSDVGKKLLSNVYDRTGATKALNYDAAQLLKREIDELTDFNPMAPKQMSNTDLKNIRHAIRQDTGNIVERAGGPKAKSAYDTATKTWREIETDKEGLRSILGPTGDNPPNKVYENLFSTAKEGSKKDLDLLNRVQKVMGSSAWDDFRSGIIKEMGSNPMGEFHPTDFVKKFSQLNDDAKNVLFGAPGSTTRDTLENAFSVSRQYVERGKPRNLSNWAMAAGTVAAVGAVGDVFSEGPVGAGKTIGIPALGASIPALAAAWMLSNRRLGPLVAEYAKTNSPAILKKIQTIVTYDPEIRSKLRRALVPELRETFQGRPVTAQDQDREERASGGRLGNRDYPAKRLSRVERAAKRAMDAIALETKPLMDQPDQVIADALKLASSK